MESSQGNSCSVIQYFKGTNAESNVSGVKISNSFETNNSVDKDLKEFLTPKKEDIKESIKTEIINHDEKPDKTSISDDLKGIKAKCRANEPEEKTKADNVDINKVKSEVLGVKLEPGLKESELGAAVSETALGEVKPEPGSTKEEVADGETQSDKRGKKRKLSGSNEGEESGNVLNASAEDADGDEEGLATDFDDDEEELENKPRRRGRCKKNPDIIPPHLSSDIILGYKILLKFLETPQFSGFHKPFKRNSEDEDCKITCLNQIKKKFEENSYKKVCEFVNDVREMLVNIYESRNPVAIKKALRLEQILEQRIAQLPNYLRPQCALVLSPEEVNNSHNKIRISKGGGFVSLLLEKTEKKRYEKNKEKRKLLAEERKQLKEEQDKDVQEWEKNVLLKNHEEEIKSMWELPAIGHFIHLCADILNIGEVAQFEVERMLLMPQCSDTLDLIMTALLTNSLVRAKLDRTPSMPYSIWGPLVKTRVLSWYRTWHKEGRNEQKLFEETGIEPDFWQILGPDLNPLDYYYFHELSLFQRVWILKTLCDVDFVRKKTVHDNIRAQTLDELNPVHLGLDQHGNRYIQFKQFCGSDIRIYRQSTKLDGDITPLELVESYEGFEQREGPITVDKVFRDIWELNEKPEVKVKKKKLTKHKGAKVYAKVVPEPVEKKNLRRSVRAQQKTYTDWSDSENESDTDLITLKNKLSKADTETLYRPFSDKEFISLSVFRLPRDKVNKPTSKKSSYSGRRTEDSSRNESTPNDKALKPETGERKEEPKLPSSEDDQSFSLDVKQMQDIQADFEKIFQGDDINGDEFNLQEKITNCKLKKDTREVNFTVKNLENLKMVFTKGNSAANAPETPSSKGETAKTENQDNTSSREKEYDDLYKYNVPEHLKPDSSKFYLVVDSVESLRQLISKFGSHENDLEIISRSTKSKKRTNNTQNSTSSEVQLIERLQNLLLELEPWELDFMKSHRTNKEKMYKEYMSFINRPPDFVHPNQSYWMKTYEEPVSTTSTPTTTTTTTTITTADESAANCEKSNKEGTNPTESADTNLLDSSLDTLIPRKRTRITRVQLQPDNNDLDEDFDDIDDYESNESDDNWVMPTPKRKAKKETTTKTPKLPKRFQTRRSKAPPLEKTESQGSAREKSQTSTPEKSKKALFWGPRSSDPSEDLNWEKNRQKILEQHNSPVKKVLLKSDDSANDMHDFEHAVKNFQDAENSSSVIKTSFKRLAPQIPGNKKPYFSSAQLKAMEHQGKKPDVGETQTSKNVETLKSNLSAKESKSAEMNDFSFTKNKNSTKIQTYSRIKKAVSAQPSPKKSSPVNSSIGASASKTDCSHTDSQQLVEFAQQINKQIQRPLSPMQGNNQKMQVVEGSLNQSHQPVNRIQQIQIQQSSGQMNQNKSLNVSMGNVRMQQPVQWQPKVITVQPFNQQGKIIQQQVQTPTQVQVQGQPQVQLSNQGQQLQQVIRLEPQKVASVQQTIQVPADKLTTVPQVVITQNTPVSTGDDLYITDGKNLIKFDNNFVQQYLQKDKVVTLNVNDKLDLKKTLLIVKPKTTVSTASTSQTPTESAASQQSILVVNKPVTAPQTAASSASSVVVSTNTVQPQPEQQTVKIVQQAPAYVIQQKPVANKGPHQIIKIITSQPMATNPNLLLAPNNINVIQVLQPVTQTVMAGDQQNKPATTLRFVRPQNSTLVQNKTNSAQSQIIVNNLVQMQGQRLESPEPQKSVASGRILSTAVPTVRMATPAQNQTAVSSTVNALKLSTNAAQNQHIQTQTVLVSTNSVRTAANINSQQVRLMTPNQQQASNQTLVVSANSTPQFVTTMTNPQTLRIATDPQTQVQNQTIVSGSSPQIVWSTVNPQQVKPGVSAQTQSASSSVSFNPQLIRTAATLTTQSASVVVSAQPVQAQTVLATANPSANLQTVRIATASQSHTVVPSATLNSQTARAATAVSTQAVRLVAGGQTQPVRFVANNSVGVRFINRNVTPVKVMTSSAQIPVVTMSVPSGIAGQAVRLQTIVQPAGMKPTQTRLLNPTKAKTNASAPTGTPVIFKVEEGEEDSRTGKEGVSEPVTLDYIRGELSVKKTSQGWKYAVKASNGKDIILTDEQIEERLKANNGTMK